MSDDCVTVDLEDKELSEALWRAIEKVTHMNLAGMLGRNEFPKAIADALRTHDQNNGGS